MYAMKAKEVRFGMLNELGQQSEVLVMMFPIILENGEKVDAILHYADKVGGDGEVTYIVGQEKPLPEMRLLNSQRTITLVE